MFQWLYSKHRVSLISYSERETFRSQKEGGLTVFQLIMKLLYAQSDRDRFDFTSVGGPHIRVSPFFALALPTTFH